MFSGSWVATRLVKRVQKGGPSSFDMALIPYKKPHATAQQRVEHLRRKGLIIARPKVAAEKIEAIGYERLRIYFLSRRDLHNLPGRPFLPNTSYRDIIQLYECDMKLRDACFVAVGQFELLFRNSISEALSRAYGSHPYSDPSAFKDAASQRDAVSSFRKIYKQSKDGRARHYAATYSTPALPPIWTMKEFLTFGAASRIFQCLSGSIRSAVAKDFGVDKEPVFTAWVECLVDLRNICAHHDRLFNRSFQKQPGLYKRANVPTAPRNRLKAILECLDYLMAQRGSKTQLTAQVGRIIARHPAVLPREVGY